MKRLSLNHFNTFSCRALQFWFVLDHPSVTSFALCVPWLSKRGGKRQRVAAWSPPALFLLCPLLCLLLHPMHRRLRAEILPFLFKTLVTHLLPLHPWWFALGFQPEVNQQQRIWNRGIDEFPNGMHRTDGMDGSYPAQLIPGIRMSPQVGCIRTAQLCTSITQNSHTSVWIDDNVCQLPGARTVFLAYVYY